MSRIAPQKTSDVDQSFSRFESLLKSEEGRRSLFKIVAIAMIILLLLIAVALLLVLRLLPDKNVLEETKCAKVCHKLDYLQPHPPLIIISLDGYAHKYLSRRVQPVLEKIAQCGVTGEVFPSFPSQTFPNHVSISNGFHPGHHGIVGNRIYDPSVSPELEHLGRKILDGYYVKEPIWSVYQRETKRKAGTIMWIGSYHNSTYYQQPHYMVPFNKSVRPEEKLDQAFEWLKLDDDKRPGLIMVYIVEPDHTGHSYSHMEYKVNEAIKLVDDAIGNFINKLKAEGILGCVNIVVVSDHGMREIKNQVVLEQLFPLDNMIISAGTNTIIFKNGSDLSDEEIMGALTCKRTDLVRVFTKTTVPLRFHYSASKRIGDFIVVGNKGTQIYSRAEEVKPEHKGNHGFDYLAKDMHAIMFAQGPSFKEQTVLPPFHIVEYMNLWTKLLQLSAQSNDGEPDFMNLALVSGGRVQKKFHPLLRKCKMTEDLLTKSLTTICGECSVEDKKVFSNWAQCKVGGASEAVSVAADTDVFCYVSCNDVAIMDERDENAFLGALIEMHEKDKINVDMMSPHCTFHLTNRTEPCRRSEINETVEYRGLSAFPGRVLAQDHSLVIPWKTNFITEILDPLNDYTTKIAQKFDRVLTITGTAYDEDYDGVYSNSSPYSPYPTHLFRILITCRGEWAKTGNHCEKQEDTSALTFVLPHMNGDPNCLEKNEFLLQYTATIKDVEILTGLIFNFTYLSDTQQMLLKTYTAVTLW